MSTPERRKSPRLAPTSLLEVVVNDGSDAQALCRILEISPSGLRLEFSTPEDAGRFASCPRVTVTRCGKAIADLLLGRACAVRWRQGSALGVRFETPLEVTLGELGDNLEFVSL